MPAVGGNINESVPGFHSWLPTPAGRIARISTMLSRRDHLGACKARWGIGRMSYTVPAGLYAIGSPSPESPVLVTANYKMSYDCVRACLAGADVWLLVLETNGINVWCAAGHGSFGTVELATRIAAASLSRIVTHRRIIVPLLGAPGIAAHKVKLATGFQVVFGPAHAALIKDFLAGGCRLTPEMSRLSFSLYDRLVMTPVEIVHSLKFTAALCILIFAAYCCTAPTFSWQSVLSVLAGFLGAWLCGVFAAPVLLPWLPTRSFAAKGWELGVVFTSGWALMSDISGVPAAAAFLLLPPLAAFGALNFTGCTPFTSRSGVKKELRWSLPVMVLSLLSGCILLFI